MNCLKYLIKGDINRELDKIIDVSLELFNKCNGEKCKICGITQGSSLKGFKKYYCKHKTEEIDKKMKKEKEKIVTKLLQVEAISMIQDMQSKS